MVITHFYSSEPYGKHMSIALNAVNRQIDILRNNVSISGTKIRGDSYKYREYLHPEVYRDFIVNVCFIGAPSSGKSTIAKTMAKEYNTVFMPEYGREYWDKYQENKRLSKHQLLEIAKEHILREDKKLYEANKYLFTDTNAITTYLFSKYYHNGALPELKEIAEQCITRYDIIFLCDIDIPYDNTWDRSGEVNRRYFHKKTIQYLEEHKIQYILLSGNPKRRGEQVDEVLKHYKKYPNSSKDCH